MLAWLEFSASGMTQYQGRLGALCFPAYLGPPRGFANNLKLFFVRIHGQTSFGVDGLSSDSFCID